jgi:hypothetical protein
LKILALLLSCLQFLTDIWPKQNSEKYPRFKNRILYNKVVGLEIGFRLEYAAG